MYTYRGPLLSGRLTANKTMFSEEAIKELVDTQPNVPVRINFRGDPIGSTTAFFLRSDGVVEVEADLQYSGLDQLDVFFAPGGTVELNDVKRSDGQEEVVINHFALREVSLTHSPADTSLSAIFKKE